MARQLDDAAARRQVSAQDREPAGRLERLLDRHHHRLAGRLHHLIRDLAQRPAVDRHRTRMDQLPLGQLSGHQRDATGVEDVGRDVLPARLQTGHDRRPGRDRVEVVDRERNAQLARDRQQMQHAIGRAAGRGNRRGRVLERLPRHDLRGAVAEARDHR